MPQEPCVSKGYWGTSICANHEGHGASSEGPWFNIENYGWENCQYAGMDGNKDGVVDCSPKQTRSSQNNPFKEAKDVREVQAMCPKSCGPCVTGKISLVDDSGSIVCGLDSTLQEMVRDHPEHICMEHRDGFINSKLCAIYAGFLFIKVEAFSQNYVFFLQIQGMEQAKKTLPHLTDEQKYVVIDRFAQLGLDVENFAPNPLYEGKWVMDYPCDGPRPTFLWPLKIKPPDGKTCRLEPGGKYKLTIQKDAWRDEGYKLGPAQDYTLKFSTCNPTREATSAPFTDRLMFQARKYDQDAAVVSQPGMVYEIDAPVGVVRDVDGNLNHAESYVIVTDFYPPEIDYSASTNHPPVNFSASVSLKSHFVVTFNEPIKLGTSGKIRVHPKGLPVACKIDPASTVEASRPLVWENMIAFSCEAAGGTLAQNAVHHFEFDAGVVTDIVGNPMV